MANTAGSIDIADAFDVEVETQAISEVLVCADGATAIRRVTRVNGVDTVTYLTADGAPITPTTWMPGECLFFSPSVNQEEICADGEPAFRIISVDPDGDINESFIGIDGSILTPIEWFPGSCCACDATPITMTSGLRKVVGVTPLTPAGSNYRSITVIAAVNTVQVSFGGSDVAIIPAGISMTWGASGPQDAYLGVVPTFTGQAAGSEYFVSWIKHP